MKFPFGRHSALKIAFCLLACALATFAQFNASLQGTVLDPNGASVPGAKVTATNQGTGRTHEVVASDNGFYRISALPPGKYTVKVEAKGFKKSETKDVDVTAEQIRGMDVKLELGTVEQVVTVTAGAEALQTENGSISTALTNRELQRLPQYGRDPYELLRLAPGIFGDGARQGNGNSLGFTNTTGPGGSDSSIYQVENRTPISANGQRVSNNNFTIDGVGVNSLQWGGAAVVTPNQDSVQEITVLSSSYSAEDGRNSGAQVKVVTKSGTNQFHGGSFIKFNDAGLNSYNKFTGLHVTSPPTITCPSGQVVGTDCPERVNRKYRQFGAHVGGPAWKDKLFFFFSYEGQRERSSSTEQRFVETQAFRQAVIAARPTGITTKVLQAAGIQPRIATVLPQTCTNFTNAGRPCAVVGTGLDIGSLTGAPGQYVSLGNPVGGGLDGVADVQFVLLNLPRESKGNQFNSRIDYNWGQNQFAFSFFVSQRDNLSSDLGAQSRPMADIRSKPRNSAYFLAWIRPFATKWLNEARFNFTRFHFNELESSSNVNFGIPRVEVEGLPLTPGGERIRFGAPRSEATPAIFAQNTYSIRDTVSYLWRAHAFKFGYSLTKEEDNNNLAGGARPVYSFVGLFNLANDTPIFEGINTNPTTGAPADAQRYFRTWNHAFFVQDDWKIRPNLTFNIGLRYEFFSPLREKNARITNLILGTTAGQQLTGARVDVRSELFNPDRNNLAPLLGFAWSPKMFHDKMVWRGGFGVHFNRIPNVLYANTRGNVPFFARWGLCCGTSLLDFGTPFAGGTIQYVLGSSNAITSYPVNTALVQTLNPATNLPVSGGVEIWGAPLKSPNSYVYAFSLGAEYQLPWKLVTSLGYQGSSSHKLVRIVNQNFLFTNNPAMFATFFITPDVNSNYHSMNFRLSRRFAQGYQFDFDYRWSKSLDTLSFEGPGFVTNQTFPQNNRLNYGPSDFDAKHYVRLYGLYDIPIFRNRNDWKGRLLGGWRIDGAYLFHSGFPWMPVTFTQSLLTPGGITLGPIRPIAVLKQPGSGASNDTFLTPNGNFPGGGATFFNITAPGVPGIGRNSLSGPRFTNVDMSFVKDTRLPQMPFIGENSSIEFRASLFNVFNKLNLAPFNFASAPTVVENSRFGSAERGLAGRVVEFQMRFSF